MKHRFLCVLLPVYSLLDGSVGIPVLSLVSLVPSITAEAEDGRECLRQRREPCDICVLIHCYMELKIRFSSGRWHHGIYLNICVEVSNTDCSRADCVG